MRTSEVPELQRRLARLRDKPVSSGMLSPQESAALSDVGFRQVSEVIGAVAVRVPAGGFFQTGTGLSSYPRGWQGGPDGGAPPVYTSSTKAPRVPARVSALRTGFRVAIRRLVDEVRAVGGDGVVGLRVEQTTVGGPDNPTWHFLASGTAICSTGSTRAASPFTSALTATQTAVALRAGWVPVSYLACPVMAVRWVEPESRQRERLSAPNGEIDAYSEAVNVCRRQAGADFARAAREVKADAAVMSGMSVQVHSALDLAEVSVLVTGTALAQFRVARPPSPRTIISLRGTA